MCWTNCPDEGSSAKYGEKAQRTDLGINSVQGLEGVPVRAVVPPALKLFLWSLRSEFHALGTTNIYSARTAFSSNALSAKDRAQGCWMKAF